MADEWKPPRGHRISSIPRPISTLTRPRTSSRIKTPAFTGSSSGSPFDVSRHMPQSSYQKETEPTSRSTSSSSDQSYSDAVLSPVKPKYPLPKDLSDGLPRFTPSRGSRIPRSTTGTTLSTLAAPTPPRQLMRPISPQLPRSRTLDSMACYVSDPHEHTKRRDRASAIHTSFKSIKSPDEVEHNVLGTKESRSDTIIEEQDKQVRQTQPSPQGQYPPLQSQTSSTRTSLTPKQRFDPSPNSRRLTARSDISHVISKSGEPLFESTRMRIRTSEDPTAECSTSRLGSRRLSMADDDPQVWSKVPYEYWIGRLSSCLDRYRAMNIMDTDVENEPFDETDGVKRAFRELEACCASEGAFASFRNFQDTFHLVEKGQSIAPDTRTLWPQSKEARDSIVAARLGPSRGHEPSISTSALPSFMSGQMAFPTLARPTGTGGQLPRSRTMESFKSVADGLRKVTNFGVEDGPSRSSFKEDKKAFAGKGKISRGRSRVSGGRKTSGTGTATAGSGSSMRKSSADVFKRIVADGAAKVRRLRRNLGGSGSPIDEIIESSATFGSSEEWMTEEECLIGIAK